MNSEELELSLRTEFENYLKGVLAGMRQDIADFQKNFEGEFEKHRAQMDSAFRDLSDRFSSEVMFDQAFTESVVEHLRLARDDGAQLTAQAFTDAQQMDAATAAPANYDEIRDAISDISAQSTQSTILKSLVDHVARFTPRGAFFIVKNDSFICWRRFDANGASDDESVREIHFPVSFDTLLAEAVNSLATVEGSPRKDEFGYLDALGFGRPQRMSAIPLTARGRGVAVLYADAGDADHSSVNLQAIESLVRVAALTVELRAAAAALVQPTVAEAIPAYAPTPVVESEPAVAAAPAESTPEYSHDHAEHSSPAEEVEYQAETEPQYADAVQEYAGGIEVEEPVAQEVEVAEEQPVVESREYEYFESTPVETTAEIVADEVEEVEPVQVNDFAFASSDAYDASADVQPEPEPEPLPEPEPEPQPVEEYAYAGEPANVANGTNGHAYEPAPEPVVEVAAAQPTKSRFSDRFVDLPIEVSEDERRFHNDARRFARLLVSEIKLYNEQKVNEGRDSSDLYDRLREAIDRSREMYEKRVQPQVSAKFDYFHYELVTNLAEGNDTKLGASYPGASV